MKLSSVLGHCCVNWVKSREKNTLGININQDHLTQMQFKSHASGRGFGGVCIITMQFVACELGQSFELIIL